MIRSVFFILVVILATFFLAIPIIVTGIFDPYTHFSRKIARLWSKILLHAAGVRVTLLGQENIRHPQSYVVVANHQSHMDLPLIFAYLPLHMTVVSKKELFRIPVFGWALTGAGILKIDRSNSAQSIETLRKAESTILREKLSLLMFPEGTRSPRGELRRFKKGPFVFAIKTGLPILPVSILGTASILPKGTIWVRPGEVALMVHPPVETTGKTLNEKDLLLNQVHEIIERGLDELRSQVPQFKNM